MANEHSTEFTNQISGTEAMKKELDEVISEISSVEFSRNTALAIMVTAAVVTFGGPKMGAFKRIPTRHVDKFLRSAMRTGTNVISASRMTVVGAAAISSSFAVFSVMGQADLNRLQEVLVEKRDLLEQMENTLREYR